MKILKQVLAVCSLLLITAISFTSCEKDNNDAGTNSIIGTWEGEWGNGNQAPQYFIKFQINENGVLSRLNEQGQVIATGTWSVNGTQFECTYTHISDGQVHRIAGLYTDFDNNITGTWGFAPSTANGGTVDLMKE